MNKVILSILALVCLAHADSNKEWLPKGKSVGVFEYMPNTPHSPAAFSEVDAKQLTKSQKRGSRFIANGANLVMVQEWQELMLLLLHTKDLESHLC